MNTGTITPNTITRASLWESEDIGGGVVEASTESRLCADRQGGMFAGVVEHPLPLDQPRLRIGAMHAATQQVTVRDKPGAFVSECLL
jgi:hypothetical protein